MDKVLLYSGGMDSFCISKLEKPDINLYINLRTKCAEQELKRIHKLGTDIKVVIDNRINLADQEMASYTVPLRNLILICIGAFYGNEIIIGSVKGEYNTDTDENFRAKTQELIQYLLIDGAKNPMAWKDKTAPFIVSAPFVNTTKTELVQRYIEAGNSVEDLLKHSVSCVAGTEIECGECASCFRKWAALTNNDIQGTFMKDPKLSAEKNMKYIADSIKPEIERALSK